LPNSSQAAAKRACLSAQVGFVENAFREGVQSRYPSSIKQGTREIVRGDEENDSASQSVVERRR
jgi:hypothetical protein